MIAAALPLAAIGWEVLDRFRVGIPISPHGVGIALGYLAGAWVFISRTAPRRGYPEDAVSSVVFWALIGALVGARLGYVATHLSEFENPLEILAVYRGGLSQLGGVVGAIAASYLVVRRHRLPFLEGLDAAAIPIPLGVVIGRIGDLIIGDHLGKPTSWALAFRYEGGALSGYDCSLEEVCRVDLGGAFSQVITREAARLYEGARLVGEGVGVHQTALYDLGVAALLALFLVALSGRPRPSGTLFFVYIAWYGAGRIVTDFLRVENRFAGLTGSQWTSIVAVALGLGGLVWAVARSRRRRAVEGDGPDARATPALEPDPDGGADPSTPAGSRDD